jgi:hypothetical protein
VGRPPARATGRWPVSDALDRWLDGLDEDADLDVDVDVADVFVQIDALGGERAERGDARWLPGGRSDPAALARLVEERRARGVLWRPASKRTRRTA